MLYNNKLHDKYLQKYRDQYIVSKHSDKTTIIKCKPLSSGNHVFCVNYETGKLAFYFSGGTTAHPRNKLLRLLKESGAPFEPRQQGDMELIVGFAESDLSRLETIFKLRKRKLLVGQQNMQEAAV